MNTSELKLRIFRQIDSLDKLSLEEFFGITNNYIKSKKGIGDWEGLTEEEIESIELALGQLDSGAGIPHNIVMKEMKSKYFAITPLVESLIGVINFLKNPDTSRTKVI